MEQLPFIDQMAAGEFEQLMVSSLRFSKVVRFYDKQIARGESLGRFKEGITRILDLWTGTRLPTLHPRAELYTCVQKTWDAEQDVHRKVLANQRGR